MRVSRFLLVAWTLSLSACAVEWTERPVENRPGAAAVHGRVRITRANGERVVLRDAFVRDDTIFGDADADPRAEPVAIPLPDARTIESPEKSVTVPIVAGGGAAVPGRSRHPALPALRLTTARDGGRRSALAIPRGARHITRSRRVDLNGGRGGMTVDLAGRTAIVTGSSKGIGYAIAEALARANANVVVSARKPAEVTEAARRLEREGSGTILGIPADVGKLDDVRRLVDETVERLGGVDVLVNNAGFGVFAPVDQIAPGDWDRLIATNLSGVFYCCHAAIPHLRKSEDGWIINIASLAGKNPIAGGAAYNASKFGLVGFSEAMMLDVRQQGIRVSYIMPGSVDTHFNGNEPGDAGAWKIQPQDIGQVVLDLLALPRNSLVSRVEMRPSRPPQR